MQSPLKTGSWVMYAMGIYTLVMSLFWIFLTEVVFVSLEISPPVSAPCLPREM